MIVVQFADDTIVGFQHRREGGERFFCECDLKNRLAQFALSLHPGKTRLIEFGAFAAANADRDGAKASRRRSISWGLRITAAPRRTAPGFQLGRRTQRKRMRAKLKEIRAETLQRVRHRPIDEQGQWFRDRGEGILRLLRGADQYPHAVGVPCPRNRKVVPQSAATQPAAPT